MGRGAATRLGLAAAAACSATLRDRDPRSPFPGRAPCRDAGRIFIPRRDRSIVDAPPSGSHYGREYPGEFGREHLEHLGQGPAEAGLLPAPAVRGALESPVVDGDATKPGVTDGIAGGA